MDRPGWPRSLFSGLRPEARGQKHSWVLALTLPLGLAMGTPGWCRDDFGRWQGPLQECLISVEGQKAWNCQRLEVIQTSPQVISLRFLRTQDGLLSPRRLQLIGRINGGEGLDCDANGCTLTPQLHLEVTALATMQFDGRGLAKAMPIGNVARGQCQWQQRQLRCRFQVGKGPDWSIQASL
jgi:hypothetical protein